MALKRSAPTADEYDLLSDETEAEASLFTDEDEDERPARNSIVQRGWGAAKKAAKAAKEAGFGGSEFQVTKEKQLVFFLEDGPFAVYKQHWIEREGKKSFVCLGAGCPLCTKLADSPRDQFAFNIVNFSATLGDSDTIDPSHQSFVAGPMVLELLSDLDEDETEGPLVGNFYSISRVGSKGKYNWKIDFVKKRDVGDDFGVDLEEAAPLLKQFGKALFDESWLAKRSSTKEDLLAIAREKA
jgi:hypothetical protein